MIFRRLRSDDIDAVTAFVIDGMNAHKYPLILSEHKVRATVKHMQESAADFHLVAFDGDKVVGAIAAVVSESPWFERADAHVIACRAVVPGVGPQLLTKLREWADNNMRIRRVLWSMEPDADVRIDKWARRYGFTSSHRVLISYKGA